MEKKMGSATCLVRIDNQIVGDYSYIAGIVRLVASGQNESVLVVQRCPRKAAEGTPLTIVRPEEIPEDIKRHPKIAVWLDNNTGRPATYGEAFLLVGDLIQSNWQPSLGSMQPMLDSTM